MYPCFLSIPCNDFTVKFLSALTDTCSTNALSIMCLLWQLHVLQTSCQIFVYTDGYSLNTDKIFWKSEINRLNTIPAGPTKQQNGVDTRTQSRLNSDTAREASISALHKSSACRSWEFCHKNAQSCFWKSGRAFKCKIEPCYVLVLHCMKNIFQNESILHNRTGNVIFHTVTLSEVSM